MAGVNKAILIGNLGRDPELRRTPSGTSVASFSLATTERWTGREGDRQDRTEWHNVVAWGKLAELANDYLKKGRTVYVEGRISTRSWDDRDGNKKYRTEIVASTIQFLGSSGSGSGSGSSRQGSRSMGEPSDNTSSVPSSAEPDMPVEDDLPF
jgi:single-strand DNA-binding protein